MKNDSYCRKIILALSPLHSCDLFSLQAYASGCDLVILDEDFSRIQIIPGVTHGYVQITCVDCCEDTGKVRFFPQKD